MEQTADAEFWIDERPDGDGRVRLELVGELRHRGRDAAGRATAGSRPGQRSCRCWIFIGCNSSTAADSGPWSAPSPNTRRDNRSLVFEGTPLPQVRQIIDLLELHDLFWPPAP